MKINPNLLYENGNRKLRYNNNKKIKSIETSFNELLQILADNGIIELEEDNDVSENNDE